MAASSIAPPPSSQAKEEAAALLVADDLRVDVDGVPACDGITLRTRGRHVLILGAPRALFEAATGLASVVRGALTVRGVSAAQATLSGVIAGAAMETPTPPRWTVTEYVEWSARLAGLSKADARTSADAAIKKLQLGSMAKTQTSKLVPHARRATGIAAALATGAEVIALEDPLGGLADEIAASYAKVLAEALAGQPWIIFAPRIPLASPLALEADEALIASATGIDVQGPPAEIAAAERRFVGRIRQQPQHQAGAGAGADATNPVETLASLLAPRGAKVESHGGAHLLFDLGDTMTTSDLMRVCDRVNIAVIELVPISRALS